MVGRVRDLGGKMVGGMEGLGGMMFDGRGWWGLVKCCGMGEERRGDLVGWEGREGMEGFVLSG